MSNNVYIGMRYVPIFDGDWNNTKSYEPLTIVQYGNNTYTSKRPVPVGTLPTDTDYWALTGDYNGQISALDARMDDVEDAVKECANWAADNQDNNVPVTLTSLNFEKIGAQSPDFKNELVMERWTPNSNASVENSLRTVNAGGSTYEYINNGVKVTSSDTTRRSFIIDGNISKIENNMCVRFLVNGNKGNTSYCRTGINIAQGTMFLYFDNETKKITYEGTVSSWAPTALSNTTFDGDEIQFYVFFLRRQASVYVSVDGGGITYVGTTPAGSDSLVGKGCGIFIRLGSTTAKPWLKNMVACYTYVSTADCKYVHYEDTTPYIVNNKAYFTASLQAINCGFTGILRHTLGSMDVELVGVIIASGMYSGSASDLCFDRVNKRWICFFRRTSSSNNTLVDWCISHNNDLNGVIEFDAADLPTVSNHTTFGNCGDTEDPAVCFYDGHWYVALNRMNPYTYDIFRTTGTNFDITDFEFVTTITSSSLTGGCFLIVNDTLYLIAGDNTTIGVFNANTGSHIGTLGVSVANRVWGNLTAVTRGTKTVFYLTTFNRQQFDSNTWSYGHLLMFKSTDAVAELAVNNTYGTR